MAVNDVYQYTLVGSFEQQEINTVGFAQTVAENDPEETLTELATFMAGVIGFDMVKFTSDAFTWKQVITRRLRPAISDVHVLDISQSGDLPAPALSSTVYALMRYYCEPYELKQSNHFKLTGLPNDSANRGVMTDEGLLRYQDYIDRMTGGPWVTGNSSIGFVRPPKPSDVAGTPLPQIFKMFPDGSLRNLRTRQQY